MTRGQRRAVFLDRDGVVISAIVRNGKPFAATTPEDIHILPDVPKACAMLSSLGYLLILTTNQPDIARRKISPDFVEQTNKMLKEALELDAVRVCAHDDSDGCDCRKPLPGLMTHAARDFDINLAASFVVGDRWRDIDAGHAAGCRTIFIEYGYDERLKAQPDHRCQSLAEAADWIAAQQ
jgi:D-glycero-D-manno-heptose 1,7-bisphosphate phosphatase